MPVAPAVIRCKVADSAVSPAGFGTLMQSVVADPFRGQRLRLTARLKAKDVEGAGTIWMRIDRAPGDMLRFDNMEQRPRNGVLKGTTDWTEREVVLDHLSQRTFLDRPTNLDFRDPEPQ